MSNEERTGFRSLIYSSWHRPQAIKRYLNITDAMKLLVIDIDWCEACRLCSEPVALIETAYTRAAQSQGLVPKDARITALLARMAKIPAYSVLYFGEVKKTRCGACEQYSESGDIKAFLVRRIQPKDGWIEYMDPERYARFLLSLRDVHNYTCSKQVESFSAANGSAR